MLQQVSQSVGGMEIFADANIQNTTFSHVEEKKNPPRTPSAAHLSQHKTLGGARSCTPMTENQSRVRTGSR